MNCCGKELEFKNYDELMLKYDEEKKNFYCTICENEADAATIHHPVHDGPFPLSGSGRVINEIIPYCSMCEKKPNQSGSFYTPEE